MGGYGNHVFSIKSSLDRTPASLITSSSCGHTLSFSKGMDWHLISSDTDGQYIVSQLADIMGLQHAPAINNNPKLLFTSSKPDADSLSILASAYSHAINTVPETGWNVLQFPFLQVWQHSQSIDVICQVSAQREYLMDIMTMMMAMYPVVSSVLQAGGLLVHAGLVEKEGKGILLAGPGGTGKSTCCTKVPPPWRSLCDDESIVLPVKSNYQAYPFPTWSEFTCQSSSNNRWNVNHKTDLAAICFLEQADNDALIPIGTGEAAARMNESSLQILARYLVYLAGQVRLIRNTVFANAIILAKKIPAYRLQVSMNGQFWCKLEEIVCRVE